MRGICLLTASGRLCSPTLCLSKTEQTRLIPAAQATFREIAFAAKGLEIFHNPVRLREPEACCRLARVAEWCRRD